MNLLKSKLRQTTAVVAGSILGLAGVVAFAAPASAHAPSVNGSTTCATSKGWKVDWSIGNDYETDATVTIAKVTDQDGNDLSLTGDIQNGAVVKAYSKDKPAEQIKGATEVTDEKVAKVTLTVVLSWPDGYSNDGEGRGEPVTETVSKPETCNEPEPTTSAPEPTPTETDEPELPVPTPSTTDEPGIFTPIIEETCDTITVGIDNPADGLEWTLTYETSKGENREVIVKPGEKKTETFSATTGFSIKLTLAVTYEGETFSDFTTIDFEGSEECEGEGGGLPVTGAAAGGIAGGAAVLLAIGAVLFVLTRRRKVKFTA